MKTIFSYALAVLLLSNGLFAQKLEIENKELKSSLNLLLRSRCHDDPLINGLFCCHKGRRGPRGPQGPQGAPGAQGAQGIQGAQGPQGLTGIQGPIFTTPSATFYDDATASEIGNVTIASGANVPFLASQPIPNGITFNSINNTISFSETGIYLVSYGFSVAESTATFQLFLNDSLTLSALTSTTPNILVKSTLLVQINNTSNLLNLKNIGAGTATLHVGSGTGLGAFITLNRIAPLP